jgi:hypothetical protein
VADDASVMMRGFMKYLYNSLFLFIIMLAVVWAGTASELPGTSSGDQPSAAAALSQPAVEHSNE